MVTPIPTQHIQDSHKLQADGVVELFELTPAAGGGTLRFKSDNELMWRGNVYYGVPLQFSSNGSTSEQGSDMPKLVIGQPNIDLSMFKPLINDGGLDGSLITRYRVLLNNIITNASIYEVFYYRGKRVEGYDRTQIALQLASKSDSGSFTLPTRQYLPPDFPAVQI